jgi:hypothetical protein
LPEKTEEGQWYEVICTQPLEGTQVILTTTWKTSLSLEGVEVFEDRSPYKKKKGKADEKWYEVVLSDAS